MMSWDVSTNIDPCLSLKGLAQRGGRSPWCGLVPPHGRADRRAEIRTDAACGKTVGNIGGLCGVARFYCYIHADVAEFGSFWRVTMQLVCREPGGYYAATGSLHCEVRLPNSGTTSVEAGKCT